MKPKYKRAFLEILSFFVIASLLYGFFIFMLFATEVIRP